MDAAAAGRARLAEIERELARLQYRHDIAMSAFRFEEAADFGRAIAALDAERQALAADLPPAADDAGSSTVPQLVRPRRARRRHRENFRRLP